MTETPQWVSDLIQDLETRGTTAETDRGRSAYRDAAQYVRDYYPEDGKVLALSQKQAERFEAIRQECKEADPGLPELTDEQIIDTLLDTWGLVNTGFYTEGYTDNKALRKLVDYWRDRANIISYEGWNDGIREGKKRCADKLEEAIDDE